MEDAPQGATRSMRAAWTQEKELKEDQRNKKVKQKGTKKKERENKKEKK